MTRFPLTNSDWYGSICYLDGSRVAAQEPGSIKLISGEALVCADHDVTIEAGAHAVHCLRGAVALVSLHNGAMLVRDICDDKPHSVSLTVDGRAILLQPGEEAAVGPTQSSVVAALRSDAVGRRRVRQTKVSDKSYVSNCELSLISLVQNDPLMSRLKEQGTVSDQKTLDKVIKTAAAIMKATASHGPYQDVAKQ